MVPLDMQNGSAIWHHVIQLQLHVLLLNYDTELQISDMGPGPTTYKKFMAF